MTTNNHTYLTNLHNLLNQYFDLEEILTLCFELHVDYDSLRGEGKSAKIRELILLLGRQERLPELLALVRSKRPNVIWPDMPQGFEMTGASEWSAADLSSSRIIQGDLVQGDKFVGNKISIGTVINSAIGANATASVSLGQSASQDGLDALFVPLLEKIASDTPPDQYAVTQVKVSHLQKELEQGANAKDKIVAGLIEDIVRITPASTEQIISLFSNPTIASNVGSITEYVLSRIKS